jgi:hypothetical protein
MQALGDRQGDPLNFQQFGDGLPAQDLRQRRSRDLVGKPAPFNPEEVACREHSELVQLPCQCWANTGKVDYVRHRHVRPPSCAAIPGPVVPRALRDSSYRGPVEVIILQFL